MSGFSYQTECAYCGYWGQFPDDLEIRFGKIVCKDVAACDARDAAANPLEVDE